MILGTLIDWVIRLKELLAPAKDYLADANPLVVEEYVVGHGVPVRIVTEQPMYPNLIKNADHELLSQDYYKRQSSTPTYGEFCNIKLAIRNRSTRTISVKSIAVVKERVTHNSEGSICFVPQGDVLGEPKRFQSNLDAEQPSMQQVQLEGAEEVPQGEENYFDYGTLELQPGSLTNIKVRLYTETHTWKCHLTMRYQVGKQTHSEVFDGNNEFIVVPLSAIPIDQRFIGLVAPFPPGLFREPESSE